MSNHLGNVMAVVSDNRLQSGNTYIPDVINSNDYYAFGGQMPGRDFTNPGAQAYRYGFNGKENDNEVKGAGNQQDYGMRIYDPRIAKFLSVDPLKGKFPMLTPYQFASNSPVANIDLDGAESWYYNTALGWKESEFVSGPLNEEHVNKLGYFSAAQTRQYDASAKITESRYRAMSEGNARFEAAQEYEQMQNPLYIIYAFSPAKAGVESYKEYSKGNNGWGTFNLAAGVLGFAELRGLGVLGRTMSMESIWKSSRLLRGSYMEYKLASTIYNGLEHLAETVSPFFKTIDFYDPVKKLGTSLKSVASEGNFKFANIIENIDELAAAKKIGAIGKGGSERKLLDVRLDIVIPKGYDKRVLNGVEEYAKKAKVDVRITEH